MLARHSPKIWVGGLELGACCLVRLTFPQPGNSQAWTLLPFFALLMRPVGVQDDGPSMEMDEVLMVEMLSRREWESSIVE
jgi:hypothetical protein